MIENFQADHAAQALSHRIDIENLLRVGIEEEKAVAAFFEQRSRKFRRTDQFRGLFRRTRSKSLSIA
jgi:hypothetical protein